MDLAASVQQVTEEIVLRLTRSLAREGRSENLCLAGGVALNCVANGKILRERRLQEYLGAAGGRRCRRRGRRGAGGLLSVRRRDHARRPLATPWHGGYLGPSFSQAEIEQRLTQAGAVFSTLADDALIQSTVKALVAEKAVGWFQGRMEFGPRALGARSILGDPRSPTHAELAQPAGQVPRELSSLRAGRAARGRRRLVRPRRRQPLHADRCRRAAERRRRPANPGEDKLFGIERLNIPRSEIPAVTHVDYSARIQTVHADTNPRFHDLLTAFKAETGCPVLVNTSFNVRGEPIVCTPEDAFRCFMGSDIEVLVVGNCFLNKEDQPSSLKLDYKNMFELD